MKSGMSSPLKDIPRSLSSKQALFFDGMSHAADIAEFAYRRLQNTLHSITLSKTNPLELITSAFLDAWTCVDAIDRFRSLLKQYPPGGILPRDEFQSEFIERTREVRELRNVADHVHQRIDHLVSKKASASGELAWIAFVNEGAGDKYFVGAIRPGFFGDQLSQNLLIPPIGQRIEIPAGYIHLKAGAISINLSNAMHALFDVIQKIELELHSRYKKMGDAYVRVNRDIVMSAELKSN